MVMEKLALDCFLLARGGSESRGKPENRRQGKACFPHARRGEQDKRRRAVFFAEENLISTGDSPLRMTVVRALVDVRDAGFHNYNLDLIYGSSRETREEFEEDIRTALRFSPTHISAYCLTIEPGTEFATLRRKGKLSVPDDLGSGRVHAERAGDS